MIHKLFRRLRNKALKLVTTPVTLVHTPKCAGTFIQQAYRLHERPWIRTIGHGRLRDTVPTGRHHAYVGLIREPVDWYASYLAFCRRSLAVEPQGVANFPATHPISIFSDNGRRTVAQMVAAMADRSVLERLCADRVVASIYARDIPDVFEFMLRTGTGFWTWTMMHHFANTTTDALRTAADVRSQAEWIAGTVSFIHQDNLHEDVQRVLRLRPPRDRSRINSSERPSGDLPGGTTLDLVAALDGVTYGILAPGHCPQLPVGASGRHGAATPFARGQAADAA